MKDLLRKTRIMRMNPIGCQTGIFDYQQETNEKNDCDLNFPGQESPIAVRINFF